jgi:hypothetical protein
MSKKNILKYLGILVLSVVITIGLTLIGFVANLSIISNGFPLPWSDFNLLGSDTNYFYMLADMIFWFIALLVVWEVLAKVLKK